MSQTTYRIPLEIAHRILATFGITEPSPVYERRVKDDGFDIESFDDVLYESPFIFILDWRSNLQEELELVREALGRLEAVLELEFDEEGNTGFVSDGKGRRAPVKYVPADEDEMGAVFRALQSVAPANLEFRVSPHNEGSDGWIYAVLPRDEWRELEELAPRVIEYFFRPLAG